MKRNVKVIALLMAVIGLIMLVGIGCSQSESDGSGQFTIGWVTGDDIYSFNVRVRQAVVRFGEEAGMRIMVADARSDVNNEVNHMENYIAQGVDVVATMPRDPVGSAAGVRQVWAAGIPYIGVTGVVEADQILVGGDDVHAGQLQAEFLAQVLPPNGTYLYMTVNPVENTCIRRKEGMEILRTLRPDVRMLAEEDVRGRADRGMTVTENWLQVYDHVDAIVSQNDDAALGAIEALKAAGRLQSTMVIGIDGGIDALRSIQAGELTASAYYDADGVGRAVIEVASQIRNGVSPSQIADILVPFKMITRENVEEFISLVDN